DKLPLALGILSVSNPDSPEVAAYSWADLLAVRAGAVGNPTEASAGLSAARVQASVSLTPAAWLRELEAQVSRALDATQRVISLLRELSPDAPPGLRRVEEALQELQRWLRSTLADRPGSTAAAPTPEALPTPAEDPAMPQTEIVLGGDAVRSREEAYRLLAVAAEYLLRTEPHSPTPYLVQRAVSWGRMPLVELLEEYGRDGNDLRALRALLGLGEES
ncbi:MAG TPA: hypothetical protein VFI96_08005, partial [Longimicrobiaceae bacterium]|nr:hypothetical protein [Longimicrobiaceae bacterium]